MGTIAFQGQPGAYSDLACRTAYPDMTTLPCELFETAMEAVRDGTAALGCYPVRTVWPGACRTSITCCPAPDCSSSASISSEWSTACWRCRARRSDDLRRAHSHTVALGQVRHSLRSLGLKPVVQADTAGAAQLVAEWGRKEEAAIASSLAAEIYGLQILRSEHRGRGA